MLGQRFAFDTLDEVLDWSERSAAVTHDHPEGIRGAQATAAAAARFNRAYASISSRGTGSDTSWYCLRYLQSSLTWWRRPSGAMRSSARRAWAISPSCRA